MKVLIVYESMFGNTEKVARAVADGLAEHAEVLVTEVSRAPAVPEEDVALLVVGAPTHAFSMPRASTRADAQRQGAVAVHSDEGVREWIDRMPFSAHRPWVATFDTRVTKVRRLPGSAARKAMRNLLGLGYRSDSTPESFYVEDTPGPLAEGELERAHAWGKRLASTLLHHPV